MNTTGCSFSHTRNRAPATPTVFVVDDDASSRRSLSILLRSAGWDVLAAASAKEFLEQPRQPLPGCLLIEHHLPDLDGLELQRIVAQGAEVPIILMSRDADIRAAVQAMKAGAQEFLPKPFMDDVLLRAVSHAIQRSYASLHRVAKDLTLTRRFKLLSRREREVMDLVVGGLANKHVAHTLGISEITVKAHRGRVMRKMHAGSLAALVNMRERLREKVPA